MEKFRVLIVDDSTVMRRLISDALAQDPSLEIAGTAANGRIALAKIPQINPDIVTLDVHMPEMDGLAALVEIRKTHPRLPVIMFSVLTQAGASAAINALSLGASDCVAKPTNANGLTDSLQRLREELIPKIKMLCESGTAMRRPPSRSPLANQDSVGRQSRMNRPSEPIEIIAIGVSTGGPNALAEILPDLPANLPVPVVIVQHMPAEFTKYLAERLNAACKLEVREAAAGDVLQPGGVWLAPGGFHMTLARNGAGTSIRLDQGPPENSCRPAVDVLFRSVAELYGSRSLAVVLTGMGRDGLRGCHAIQQGGGRILIQDEATSVVWGMPGAVAEAGIADGVLSLSRIAGELTRWTTIGRRPMPRTIVQSGNE